MSNKEACEVVVEASIVKLAAVSDATAPATTSAADNAPVTVPSLLVVKASKVDDV